jgi:hypothetical protein
MLGRVESGAVPVIAFEGRRVSPGCRETQVLYARVTAGAADTCGYKPARLATKGSSRNPEKHR